MTNTAATLVAGRQAMGALLRCVPQRGGGRRPDRPAACPRRRGANDADAFAEISSRTEDARR